MTEQRVLMQPAYVLHQRPYRDTSALLELFTHEYGRVGLVAKGVRGAKSRWRGVIQIFQPMLVSWTLRGDLGTLTGVEPQGPSVQIPAGMIASGFYLNEILMRLLTRHDAHEYLFDAYDATLRSITQLADDPASNELLESSLRQFEIRLLAELGYGLVLDHDIETGQAIRADQDYHYFLERGPVAQMSGGDGRYSESSLISGQSLIALSQGDLSEASTRQQAKRLLRRVLGHYLGPKPLLSRRLMRPPAAVPAAQA